jgi:ParB family chromosome partitioning protein
MSMQPTGGGARRGGLGRGLGALIPQATAGSGLAEVDVDRIVPTPWQPRLEIDEADLADLADSIRQHGVLQPLIVTKSEGDQYALVAGERRWRAARAAGLLTVPVVVKEATPRQRLELALVENIQRQDLSPLETAHAYRQLIDEHALTQEAVAERVGKSRVSVTNVLRLLQLPPDARDALASGMITEGHARAILSCDGEANRAALLDLTVNRHLSVRQAEELARRLNAGGSLAPKERSAGQQLPPDLAAIEDRFRQALGTKVQLYKSRRGGRLVIHFFSDEELDGLYQAIRGRDDLA